MGPCIGMISMELILVEIAVILLLLIINGIFSMSELAIVSARRIRLQHRADKGRQFKAVR